MCRTAVPDSSLYQRWYNCYCTGLRTLHLSLALGSIGLDGAVLVEVMQDRGLSTLHMEGYAQRLRRGEGSTGADLVHPRLLDFWQVKFA